MQKKRFRLNVILSKYVYGEAITLTMSPPLIYTFRRRRRTPVITAGINLFGWRISDEGRCINSFRFFAHLKPLPGASIKYYFRFTSISHWEIVSLMPQSHTTNQ